MTDDNEQRPSPDDEAKKKRAGDKPEGDQQEGGDKPAAKDRAASLLERRPWLKTAAIVFVILLAIAGAFWWWDSRRYQSTDDAQVDGYIYPVSARVAGHVVRVHVQDGQPVKTGEPLVDVDDRDYQVALARAQGDYATAEANASAANLAVPVSSVGSTSQIRSAQADVATAIAGVAAAEKTVEQAKAQVAQAQAEARTANADVERYRPLAEKREVSRQQFDQVVAAADAANAQVTAREAAVRASEEGVRQAQEKVRQARAALENARASTGSVEATAAQAKASAAQAQSAHAALQQAELNLSYTHIVAPTDGIVGRRTAQIGQNVEPGQELMMIVPTADLWVTANFKETQLTRMRAEQPVEVSVDGCDHDLQGRVTAIGGATGSRYSLLPPENASGNFVKVVQRIPVRIDLDAANRDRCLLRPGMSVVPSVKVR